MQNISPELLYWGVACLLPLLALLLAWPLLVAYHRARQERRLLNSLGEQQLHNVLIDDGVEGAALFERLVLDGSGIHFYLSERREGSIFAGERLEQWAAVQGNTTRRFTNPLYRMRELLAVLRYHLPKTPVAGHVVFFGSVSFPKGRPDEVLLVDELSAEPGASVTAHQKAWDKLSERASTAPAELLAELVSTNSPGRGRLVVVAMLLLLEGAWLLSAR